MPGQGFGLAIHPAWSCRDSAGAACSFVTTPDDQPPKGWRRVWRGFAGWVWFCPQHDPRRP